jgi:hypothetical protein
MSTDLDALLRFACCLALLSLVACPGTLDDPARFEQAASESEAGAQDAAAPCDDIPSSVLAPRCGLSSCHDSSGTAAGLDLVSPNVFGRLVGKNASGGPGVLIDPGGSPQKSVLYLKLLPSPPFGAQMPFAGDKLDAATLACVAAWIASGGAGSAGDAAAVSDANATPASPTTSDGGMEM